MTHWHFQPIWLASASPRRRELLQQIQVPFDVILQPVDESVLPDEAADDFVVRIARAKAQAGWQALGDKPQRPVLGADTAVVVDSRILGKPRDAEEACAMLRLLAGRSHQVLTAVAVCWQGQTRHKLVSTEVTFRPLSDTEIEAYWRSGEPADKAGAYGIQGLGGRFVTHIKGSYPAVVGLPLLETEQLLRSVE